MATHFYFNGHTYEIEPGPLTWADASINASTSLSWDDDGAFGNTVSAYLANIASSAEAAVILKNIKASVPKGETTPSDGNGSDYLWIGSTDTALNLAGQMSALSGSNLLWSIVEWDGLIGTETNEKMIGTDGDDIIDGNSGNDSITAKDGHDIIYMGDGDDKVNAGTGDNRIYAETSNVDSDDGNDTVTAGDGDDFIAPGTGDDIVKAGDGNNTVIGGEGDDKITTGSGNDIINRNGYYAEDSAAGAGNDIISTGAGDDYIYLGVGFDTVRGGTGNDIFEFNAIPEGSSASSVSASNGSSSSGGLDFSTGAASSSGSSAGGTTVTVGGSSSGSSSSSTTATVTTIKDFNAGTNGGVVDQLAFDSAIFEAFASGITTTNFLKGKGLTGPSSNQTGGDDYLIFDTSSGKLYYDADGNGTESETVLLCILKGKMADFNIEDILIIS